MKAAAAGRLPARPDRVVILSEAKDLKLALCASLRFFAPPYGFTLKRFAGDGFRSE